jgi:hypothetical protein
MRRRPGKPRTGCDASGLGEHVIMTIGYLAKLGDGLGQVAPLGDVAHCGVVNVGVQQLAFRGHALPYRTPVRFC